MSISDLYDKNACSIAGHSNQLMAWNWNKYKKEKQELWNKLVLVDMIDQPVLDSVPISDEMFTGKYPEGTLFALYCHSGWSSGYLQMKLSQRMPQYTFINIRWGISAYSE